MSWTSRILDGTKSLTVGPSGMARHQGTNMVSVYSRLTDQNTGENLIASRTFSIDWSQDFIQVLTAKTSSLGNLISQG